MECHFPPIWVDLGYAQKRNGSLCNRRGLCGSPQIATVKRMVPICLVWRIWRQVNDRLFEDCKWTLEEFKTWFLHPMFLWVAFIYSNWLSFYDFLSLFLYIIRFSFCITYVLGMPSTIVNKMFNWYKNIMFINWKFLMEYVIMPSNPPELYTNFFIWKKITCFSDCEGVTAERYWWHYSCRFHWYDRWL